MKTLRNCHGQSLMIAIMMVLILFIVVPVIVYVNQSNAVHQAGSEQRVQALATARMAISYAKNILSTDQATWNAAIGVPGRTFGATDADCTSGSVILGPDGSRFRIQCDGLEGALPYQVHIKAFALDANNNVLYTLNALVSQRTLAVALPEDVRASLALAMVNDVPAPPPGPAPGPLIVHWGPAAVFDNNAAHTWNLTNALDQLGTPPYPGIPRKFSNTAITGSGAFPRNAAPTDLREYWANAELGVAPAVNDDSADLVYGYSNMANAQTGLPAAAGGTQTPVGSGSGHYVAGSGPPYNTVVFDGTSYNAGTPGISPQFVGTPSIYVDDGSGGIVNAEFDHLALDMTKRAGGPYNTFDGAFIVTGDLILKNLSPSDGLPGLTVHVPPKAALEYSYLTQAGNTWFCQGAANCDPTTGTGVTGLGTSLTSINFRGFLWVKGNLFVQSGSWVLNGAVLVGDPSRDPSFNANGKITVAPGASLAILYDDKINHAIHMSRVVLQTDSMW